MSSRRGKGSVQSARDRKRSKRWRASCGPGPASGWYWTVAAGDVAQGQALDGAVVEVEVGQLGGAEVGLPADRLVALDPRLAAGARDREAVVLGGDVDAAAVSRSLTGWLAPRWPKGSL